MPEGEAITCARHSSPSLADCDTSTALWVLDALDVVSDVVDIVLDVAKICPSSSFRSNSLHSEANYVKLVEADLLVRAI